MKPEFERRAIETALVHELPAKARWMINGTSLDFSFGLRELPDEVSSAATFNPIVFGLQDFAEGGGAQTWLCVFGLDGSVKGLDPDRDEPIFLLNSSVQQFVRTFWILNEYLAKQLSLPRDCEIRLQTVDPEAYPKSDWKLLVECLRRG